MRRARTLVVVGALLAWTAVASPSGVRAASRVIRESVRVPARSLAPAASVLLRTRLVPGRPAVDGIVPVRSSVRFSALGPMALGEGALWVISQDYDGDNPLRGMVYRVDPLRRRVVGAPIPVGVEADGIAVGEGAVWVSNALSGTVSKIDPRSMRVVATIGIGDNADAIAVGLGSVWIATNRYPQGGHLFRIDPRTNRLIGKPLYLGQNTCGMFGIALAAGSLWVTSDAGRRVLRVDASSGKIVGRIRFDGAPIDPVAIAGAVWFWNETDGAGHMWRLDTASGRATVVKGRGSFARLAAGYGELWDSWWVNEESGSRLVRLDPRTGRPISRPVRVEGDPDPVVGQGGLWVISWEAGSRASLLWVDPSAAPGRAPETAVWLT